MISGLWTDDPLLAELGTALRGVHAALPACVDRGLAAWSWRAIDAELARAGWHFDSSRLDGAAVRSGDPGPAGRLLVFTAAPLSMEIELTADGLVGQLVPAGEGEIELEGPDGVIATTRSDRRGFFVLPAPPSAPVRLSCRTPSARLVTDWLRPWVRP